jgi:hypothetical protein
MNLRHELGDQTERSRARRSNNLVPNYNGYVPSVTGFVSRMPKALMNKWLPGVCRRVTREVQLVTHGLCVSYSFCLRRGEFVPTRAERLSFRIATTEIYLISAELEIPCVHLRT